MLRNVAKLLSLVTLCAHCSYLSWTWVWTVWERVYFGGLELSAGISAFCLSSSCLLCFSFHLPVLNCRGCDFPSLSLKMKHSVASLTRLQSETFFFFFCSVVNYRFHAQQRDFCREKIHWWSGIFQKTLSSRRRGDMQTFSKVLKWRSCLSQQ